MLYNKQINTWACGDLDNTQVSYMKNAQCNSRQEKMLTDKIDIL